MSELPAVELLPLPVAGRRFAGDRSVRLGDVDPTGELRFDAIATYLQDIASDDALESGYTNALGWLVRRTLIAVARPAVVNERLALTTFCTGAGRSWAERRTSITGEHGAGVEAVSLWVQIDVATGRPARLGDDFFRVWGDAAGERIVSSKLSLHGAPPDGASRRPWSFRRADLDPFAHVNNAAVWSAVEEVLQREGRSRSGMSAEVEYLAPISVDTTLELSRSGDRVWLADDGRIVTAMLLGSPGTVARR